MKTLSIQDLLKRYKIDVELFNLEDTFDLENMAYKRRNILEKFSELTEEEKKEFLEIDKEFQKYIPEIKELYPRLYELVIEPVNKKLEKINKQDNYYTPHIPRKFGHENNLIMKVAMHTGLPYEKVYRCLNTTLSVILNELRKKTIVEIEGLGTFKVKKTRKHLKAGKEHSISVKIIFEPYRKKIAKK